MGVGKMGSVAALSLALSVAAAGLANAQAQHDYKAAPAGTYTLDPKHTGLIARVSHGGFSISIFRFQTVAGQLGWDPAAPGKDTLSVTVDPKSITTAPVDGFSAELSGPRFLKADQFGTATFTATGFHPTSPTHGAVEGDLVLMGVTKHLTFDVDLVGAGNGMRGKPVIGVEAKTTLDPKAYGLPAFFGAGIDLVIDTEFDAN